MLVCEGRHGRLAIEYRGRLLRWQEIPVPAKPSAGEAKLAVERATEPKPPQVQRKWVPPSHHASREASYRGKQHRESVNSG